MQARLPTATFAELPGLTHEDLVLELGRDDDPILREVLPFLKRVTGGP